MFHAYSYILLVLFYVSYHCYSIKVLKYTQIQNKIQKFKFKVLKESEEIKSEMILTKSTTEVISSSLF